MSKVWKDDIGLYVKAGGYMARPGDVNGYSHAYNMGDGGLAEGDKVKACHLGGSPLVKITTDAGIVLHWHTWHRR